MEKSDPKSFWTGVKQILGPRDDSLACIEPEKWLSHFKTLFEPSNTDGTSGPFSDYVNSSLPTLEETAAPKMVINEVIAVRELEAVIKDLKPGKARFLDEISNDAIKSSRNTLMILLTHLFNTTLRLGDFPAIWSHGVIIPIHKKDDRLNVDNYRGIIISSCMGKIFIKILTRRKDNYMRASDIWRMNQCGYKQDHRTEDNLFILKSIQESYAINKRKIYMLPL